MKKYQYYIDARGEVLPTPQKTTTGVATSTYSVKIDKTDILLSIRTQYSWTNRVSRFS